MQTEFQQLVKYIKKKHHLTYRQIAGILNVRECTISQCVRRKQRHTGAKFVNDLKAVIDILEGRGEEHLPFCERCNNAHKHHPLNKPCFS